MERVEIEITSNPNDSVPIRKVGIFVDSVRKEGIYCVYSVRKVGIYDASCRKAGKYVASNRKVGIYVDSIRKVGISVDLQLFEYFGLPSVGQ